MAKFFLVLIAVLAGLVGGASAEVPHLHQDDWHSANKPFELVLGSHVATTVEGKHLSMEFGPYFKITKRLVFGVSVGLESGPGEMFSNIFNVAHLGFSTELSYEVIERIGLITIVHAVPFRDEPEIAILGGFEWELDTPVHLHVTLAAGKLLNGDAIGMAGLHWGLW